MKPERLLRAILPDVLIDNFDIVNFDKSADRFDIYLDEKKVQLKEDKTNPDIISYGFGEYRIIQDYPIRGRATYLHVRKRKWLDKSSNEIFSYDWDLSEFGLSGNFWLLSLKISYLCLPLFYETRTTPSCHPSGCAYRQL